jgi:hypothetical protein
MDRARQCLCKYFSTAQRSNDNGRAYALESKTSRHVKSAFAVTSCDGGGIMGSGVSCWVHAEPVSRDQDTSVWREFGDQ